MSGDPSLRQPITAQEQEEVYNAVLNDLDLVGLNQGERVAQLYKLPWETFIKSKLNARQFPTINSGFRPVSADVDGGNFVFTKDHWCSSLMIGDCAQDVSTCSQLLLYNVAEQRVGHAVCS